jgi:hypothetical protein
VFQGAVRRQVMRRYVPPLHERGKFSCGGKFPGYHGIFFRDRKNNRDHSQARTGHPPTKRTNFVGGRALTQRH